MRLVGLILIILALGAAPARAVHWAKAAQDCVACRTEQELIKARACEPEYSEECLAQATEPGMCIRVGRGSLIFLNKFIRVDGPAYIGVDGYEGNFYCDPEAIPPDVRKAWDQEWLDETKRLRGHSD